MGKFLITVIALLKPILILVDMVILFIGLVLQFKGLYIESITVFLFIIASNSIGGKK